MTAPFHDDGLNVTTRGFWDDHRDYWPAPPDDDDEPWQIWAVVAIIELCFLAGALIVGTFWAWLYPAVGDYWRPLAWVVLVVVFANWIAWLDYRSRRRPPTEEAIYQYEVPIISGHPKDWRP